MSRYIDADKLKQHYSWWNEDDRQDFDNIVDEQPTADVVEVVRCRECKYNISNPRRFIDDDIIMCYSWCEYLKEVNGFCSYGKRENFTGGGL